MLPGEKIEEHKQQIVSTILEHLNPNKLTPIALIRNWVRVDDEVYSLDVLSKHSSYYVLYKHPIHAHKDQLNIIDKDALVSFLKERVKPVRYEGVDLIIASRDMKDIVVTNHDGEIYVARVSENMTKP